MPQPAAFSWIERPHLAAMGRPASLDELSWLRGQGIQLILSLTEEPLRRDWINDAGLFAMHEPMIDMEAPELDRLIRCVSAIRKATEGGVGVGIHCQAGLGRSGVVVACYLVDKGLSASNAIARVRRLRPGSIETVDQEEAVSQYERDRLK